VSPLNASQSGSGQPAAGSGDRSREAGQAPFGWQWWNDPTVKSELKLSDDKARLIEGIFQKRQTEAKAWWDQLQKEQDRLTRMTRERMTDEATYALQVSKVEALASRLREGRTVMLYRIYLELQPEQFRKLQDMMDRRRTNGRGRGPDVGR
jgi:Spy/CpxP family protein refolding chaperone